MDAQQRCGDESADARWARAELSAWRLRAAVCLRQPQCFGRLARGRRPVPASAAAVKLQLAAAMWPIFVASLCIETGPVALHLASLPHKAFRFERSV